MQSGDGGTLRASDGSKYLSRSVTGVARGVTVKCTAGRHGTTPRRVTGITLFLTSSRTSFMGNDVFITSNT